MRQILFRGIRKDNNSFAFGYYRKNIFYDKFSSEENKILDTTHYIGSLDNRFLFDDIFEQVEVIDETVGQFTGLLDKNGNMIFEGDICIYDDNDSMSYHCSGEKFLVVGLKGRFTARMKPFDEYDGFNQNTITEEVEDCCTIIGNVHQNPELLE